MLEDEMLNAVLQSSPDSIIIVDTTLTIRFVNDAYLSMFNERRESLIGRDWRELKKNSIIERVLRDGKPQAIVNNRKSGDWYHDYKGMGLYMSIYPLRHRGEIIGAVASYRDVKEIRQRMGALEQQLKSYGNEIRSLHQAEYQLGDIAGESESLRKAKDMLIQAAVGSAPVLLRGESGTGKELFAQSLHNLSPRAGEPFVAINCPSLSETLGESELFGYEEGAFSGAIKGGKPGLLKIADGGTVFLDEIGDLSLSLQAKILRVLEAGVFYRVGGVKPVKVNLRFVAATNCDLEKMVREGKFRNDLYFRLCVISVDIPPLRQRGMDTLVIAESLLRGTGYELSAAAKDYFLAYDWPGNVREVKNALITMMNFSQSRVMEPECIPQRIMIRCRQMEAQAADAGVHSGQGNVSVRAGDRGEKFSNLPQRKRQQAVLIARLLEQYGYSVEGKRRTAREVGISLATLYHRIKEYGIE